MGSQSIYIIIFFLFVNSLVAQTCCSGGVPLSNNLGLPNDGKGSLIVALGYDYNYLNTLNTGSEKLDDDSRLRVTNSVLFNVGYSFSDRLSIESLFTWVNQSRTITQFGNETLTETTGIGDAVVLLKYALPDVLGENSTITFSGGTKIPFGRSDLTTSEGIQLTADLQPGSGAWDILGLFSAYKQLNFRPSASVSTSFIYRFTGTNTNYLNDTSSYEFGDVLQANIGYVDQFLLFNTIMNPGVVIKYRKSQADKTNDTEIPNTGGEWYFIRPELGITISQKINLISRLELPLYSYVEGTQLTPTTRFSIGVNVNLVQTK